MADYIAAGQIAETNIVNFLEYMNRRIQSGRSSGRQILLRLVARHDHLGTKADTCQEHLHLCRGRILRLIENDERIIQGTTTHVRKRRHLNQALLRIVQVTFCPHNLIQRIVKRTQVRIDLALQIARQKTQFFPRLDRRTRQDDPAYLATLKCLYRHRHRQIRFSGTRRTDAKYNHLLADQIHVLFLSHRFRFDRLARDRPADDILIDLENLFVLLREGQRQGVINILLGNGIAALGKL